MKHFLEISQLNRTEVESLLERALVFKTERNYPRYAQHTVANLFYENSTRTRVSFELAAQNLAMSVVNLDLASSSENKGEIIEDTLQTLVAMGIDSFVIRHQQEGIQQQLAQVIGDRAHIINAGDGTHAHPSQALLDMLTIIEQRPKLAELKIAVLGNIKHSRVANSFAALCKLLGVGELVFIAPKLWQPTKLIYGRVSDNIQEGLKEADVLMCLRVQRERLLETDHLDLQSYRKDFALTKETLSYAKSDALLMHPGPVNRDVEIDSVLVDSSQSCILQQVANGVFARMAILEALVR